MTIHTPAWTSGCAERSPSCWAPARAWGGPAPGPWGWRAATWRWPRGSPIRWATTADGAREGMRRPGLPPALRRHAGRRPRVVPRRDAAPLRARRHPGEQLRRPRSPERSRTRPARRNGRTASNARCLQVVKWTQAVMPYMKGWGRIVNIVSTSVKQPIDGLLLSNSIRPGVIGFSKSAARDLAPMGITINSVLPGSIRTDRTVELAAGPFYEGRTPDRADPRGEGAGDPRRPAGRARRDRRGGGVPLFPSRPATSPARRSSSTAASRGPI